MAIKLNKVAICEGPFLSQARTIFSGAGHPETAERATGKRAGAPGKEAGRATHQDESRGHRKRSWRSVNVLFRLKQNTSSPGLRCSGSTQMAWKCATEWRDRFSVALVTREQLFIMPPIPIPSALSIPLPACFIRRTCFNPRRRVARGATRWLVL